MKTKKMLTKALSVFLVVVMTLTAAPLSGFVGLDLPEWMDTSIEVKAANIDTAYLSDMVRRAETIINYQWTPSQNISTWKGYSYNGKSYFEKGKTVTGMPYTLFGQYSLEGYKKVQDINKTKTGYAGKNYGNRTGPAYGTCCATFVCEIFDGSFMPNGNHYSYNVQGIRGSKKAQQLTNQKASKIIPGDALSISGHIIWVSDVTDTTITIYEAAPPVTRKVVLSKEKCVNSNGYFVYGDSIYSHITRINVIQDKTVSAKNSKITAHEIPVPIEKNHGTPFSFFNGKIYSNNEIAYTAAMIMASDETVVQANFRDFSSKSNNYRLTASKAYDGLVDFSELSSGEYTLYLFVTCKFNSDKGLLHDILTIKDNFLTVYVGKFTVSGASAQTFSVTSRSATNSRTSTDKYGNTYYLYSTNMTEETYYDSSSSYPTGTYEITAKSGLNTRKGPSATSTQLSGWSYGTKVEVTATDGNWGYTSRGWICLDYARLVTKQQSTYNSNLSFDTGNYSVDTAAGLNCRTGPGTNYSKKTALTNGTKFSVTKTDGAWGYSPEYDGWLCLQYASYVSALTPSLPVPDAPTLITSTSSEIGVNETINVSWNAVDTATKYNVKVIDANTGTVVKSQTTTSTKYAYKTTCAGKFNISVSATNSQHTGEASTLYGFSVKAPLTVTFKNWDGSVISTQKVSYGKDAKAPATPTRTGYTFSKWNGDYSCVRENVTVTAEYTRNKYTVTFCDYDGTVVETQDVYYGDAATAPDYEAPTGYSFVKWDKSFSKITGNLTVKAVISWTSIYPLEISTKSAVQRNNTSYIVTSIVNNSPNAVSNAKIIAVLKTAENKLLATVVSDNLTLATGEVKNLTLTAKYDGMATKAELFVVKADDQDIPLASQLAVTVDQGTAWSAWSTSTPPSDAVQVESRTEYRYRDKSFTTSTSSSLSGWTKYDSVTTYGSWGSWSAWQDSSVSSSDVRDVKTQNITVPQGYTQYRYSRLKSTSTNHNTFCTHAQKSGQSYTRQYTDWSTTRYPTRSSGADWTCGYCGDFYTYVTQSNDTYGNYWYYTEESRWVDTSYTKTQYSYRTRTKTITNYFYKWGSWSDWETTAYSATDDRQVQTRTVYRYLANTNSNIETTEGVSRTILGNVGTAYSGRQALLFISSQDGTAQYLGQTKISSSGAYSFTFKLMSEPTIESGDYNVTLGIEGTTAAITLDPIEAPVPEYTVSFVDYDGSVISEQTVKKGKDAAVPAPLTREGYSFTGWDKSSVNIQSDLVLTAQYEIKSYDVVFVDTINNTTETVRFNHGDTLTVPDVTVPEQYNFIGWDAVNEGATTVTDNMVVTTEYEMKTYTVDFYDYNGTLLDSQTVEHGDMVIPPDFADTDEYIFISWNISGDINYVTEDITATPYVEYTQTVATPVSSVKTGTYDGEQIITLSCSTAGADIYYTTDGSDPLVTDEESLARTSQYNGTLYTGPITLDSSANLVYVAVKPGMEPSAYDYDTLAINTSSSDTKQYVVTIDYGVYDGETTLLVNEGEPVSLNDYEVYNYGYTFEGAYSDSSFTNEWDLENDVITKEMTIYLKWSINTYTVTFNDFYGNEIDSQEVMFGENASVPMVENVEGYIFTGWDGDYDYIIEDTVINATYVSEDDVTQVSIESSDNTVLALGTPIVFVATVTLGSNRNNTAVIWQSSDESIFTVDDCGTVTPVAAGTATLYVISEDSSMSDEIEITIATESGKCGENLTWYFDETTGTLTITGSGNMDDYNSTNSPWEFYEDKITSVVIGDNVTSIGDCAFYDCDALTSVTIGESVTKIGNSAFESCNSLTSVTIPDSVTTVGDYVFANCNALTSVTIGDSVTTIGNKAFVGCPSLTDINVDANSGTYSSENGILFNKDKTTLICFPAGKTTTSYTIPISVTTIDDYAFAWCDSLTSITVPDGVTTIDDYAFLYCTSLTNVYYYGSEKQWNAVSVGVYNEDLTNAAIHFMLNFSILEPSRTEIRHKDGIKLHANVEGNAPAGSYVEWTASNGKFKTEEINNGNSLKIVSDSNGYTTFTATLYSAEGEVLATDSIEMKSKAGFFDKFGSFFRSLFGGTKIYEY